MAAFGQINRTASNRAKVRIGPEVTVVATQSQLDAALPQFVYEAKTPIQYFSRFDN
jgi:hypothetical protein